MIQLFQHQILIQVIFLNILYFYFKTTIISLYLFFSVDFLFDSSAFDPNGNLVLPPMDPVGILRPSKKDADILLLNEN
jgi:hypothetical protein